MKNRLPQQGIFASVTAGVSMELDVADGDLRRGLELAALCIDARSVLGIGAPLASALDLQIPGLISFSRVGALTEKQHALWVFLGADDPGKAFARAVAMLAAVQDAFVLRESTPTFRFRRGRDLTGYEDGLANPTGEDARRAALVAEGSLTDGAFAFVQRFVHDRAAFNALPRSERDAIMGRGQDDGRELPDAPASAHTRRCDQTGFSPSIFLHRRSMPWGDPMRHGLQFMAFTKDLGSLSTMLRRMTGEEDGVVDAILNYTRPETGGFYFCPPVIDGIVDVGIGRRSPE